MNLDSIGHARNVPGWDGVERLGGKSPDKSSEGTAMDSGSVTSFVPADLQGYLSAARAPSASRQERIAALRDAISRGVYQVPIETLAKKLLGDDS
jgi:anti-sigma28 factor (negative regulator of flagellin synthesis)